MRKGLMTALALILVLGLAGYTVAQRGPQPMMGHGQMGPMSGHGMMGEGMMGMGRGMGMGSGTGMMGPMMGSPEIMGTMMSIHGEIMTLMGEMMREHGPAMMGEMTPELRQQMLERMGNILTKHGGALKERAKAAGK